MTCLAAYASGEFGIIHHWIGYGVALVLLFRLLWAFTGAAQLGLMRFYPSFEGITAENWLRHPVISRSLLTGILLTALVATGTGLVMDRGRILETVQTVTGKASDVTTLQSDRKDEEESEDGIMEDIHEFFANLMLLLVALHVTYLFVFKRPLARFMLFMPAKANTPKSEP